MSTVFNLRTKIILTILAASVVFIAAGFYYIADIESRRIVRDMKEQADAITHTVQESVGNVYSKLLTQNEHLQAIAENIAGIEGVIWVEVFDKHARVIIHTQKERIGGLPLPVHEKYIKEVLNTGKSLEEENIEQGRYNRFIPVFNYNAISGREVAAVIEIVLKLGDNMQTVRRNSDAISNIVLENLAKQDYLQILAKRLAGIFGVKHIEIFNKDAVIIAHTLKEKIGHTAEAIHKDYVLEVFYTGKTIDELDKARGRYNRFVPIYVIDDYGRQHIGGVVELVMDTNLLRQKLTGLKRNLAATGTILFALISFTLWITLSKTVITPVERLSVAIKQIAAGRFDKQLEVRSSDELGGLTSSFNTMTQDLKKYSSEIISAKEKTEGILSSMNDCLFVVRTDGTITTVNSAACLMLGYEERDMLGSQLSEYFDEFKGEPYKLDRHGISNIIEEGTVSGIEKTALTENGVKIPVSFSASIMCEKQNMVTGLVCIAQNISDRKLIEDNLKAALYEKELLLKEIHHRVKNNLHVIYSMLDLQAGLVNDELATTVLNETKGRVKSISYMHEKIYRSKDLSKVDFSEFAYDISANLLHAFGVSPDKINLNIDVGSVSLGIDKAIPCGLIINELVTNSLKYAFPEGRQGTIGVLLKEQEGGYLLEVRDNGVGLPEGFDPKDGKTLGLQLVETLVRQIDGQMTADGGDGAKFTIRFGYG